MRTTVHRLQRIIGGFGIVAVAVTAAGCSADSGPPAPSGDGATAVTQSSATSPTGQTPATSPSAQTPATSPSAGEPSTVTAPSGDTRPSEGPSSSAAPDEANDALLRAAETALATVAGSTLISIESENRATRWEVDVVTADGTEHEIEVSADGATVLRGPSAKVDSEVDKAKHRDRVAAAKLDYRDAVDKIAAYLPGGRIQELDLDTEHGVVVWQADVYDSAGTKHELDVDAATGEVRASH